MKVRIKTNLLNDKPDIYEFESNDIDILCQKMRDIFEETGTYTYTETENNVLWIEGPTKTILVAERVKDENQTGLPIREKK